MKEANKAYGLYENAEVFYEHLLQTPQDKRFGYELIPVDTMCKDYADVEWIGEPDPSHTTLRSLIQCYRERAAKKYPEMRMGLEVYVACGTRPATGGIKHSYQITRANLVYECHHDEDMHSFFTPPDNTAEFY